MVNNYNGENTIFELFGNSHFTSVRSSELHPQPGRAVEWSTIPWRSWVMFTWKHWAREKYGLKEAIAKWVADRCWCFPLTKRLIQRTSVTPKEQTPLIGWFKCCLRIGHQPFTREGVSVLGSPERFILASPVNCSWFIAGFILEK